MLAIKAEDFDQDFKQRVVSEKGQNVILVAVTEQEFAMLKKSMARLRAASRIKSLQMQAANSGVAEMSLDDINAEISAHRQERRAGTWNM